MSSKHLKTDICIVGGGFAALAALAHLVRAAQRPLHIAVIARDAFRNFGTAYATPRDEHLLNVRSVQMGLYNDARRGFFDWAQRGGPDDYLPRKLYGEYLHHSLGEARAEAAAKDIRIDIIEDEALDIDSGRVICARHEVEAAKTVLAVGNSFTPSASARYADNPWHFDFDSLRGKKGSVAVVGTGLTAIDVIVSLQMAGYAGDIVCYSGNGHLPCAHPALYHPEKTPALHAADFSNKRLSGVMKAVRDAIRALPAGTHWSYVFHGFRPFTQQAWRTLSVADRKRAISKYLWLWNMHRHRYAAPFADIIDGLRNEGRLQLRRGRVTAAKEDAQGVTLQVRSPYGEITATYPYAFKCIGPSFRVEANPLLKKLAGKNLLQPHATGYGIAVDDSYRVSDNIYALGSCLTGEYLEIIAVPELRAAAAEIAARLLEELDRALPQRGEEKNIKSV